MPIIIAILSSRIGIGALALALGLSIGFYKGWDYEHAKCAAERARIEAAAAQRDSDQGSISQADVKAREAELERQVKEHVETIRSYEKIVAGHPIGACALGPADLR